MPGGRPPKPLEEKRRTGNPGQRHLPSIRETIGLPAAAATPDPPAELGEAGRTMWLEVWNGPARKWLSTDIDNLFRVRTVALLAEEITRYRELVMLAPVMQEVQLYKGEVVTRADGTEIVRLKANPAAKMLRDAQKQLDKELSALGFDPAARARLGFIEVKAQSILQQLGQGARIDADEADIIDVEEIEIADDD